LHRRKSSRRAHRLIKEVYPITQHNDIEVQQPSHEEAEEQLVELYRLFKERDCLEPVEVFRKYW
jgi:hypothetical protein